jgi:YfiH family protein
VPTQSKAARKTEIDVLRADSLSRIPWLLHGFSTRTGGVSKAYGGCALNLGFTAHDSRAAVERNRRAFAAAVVAKSAAGTSAKSATKRKSAPSTIVTLRQIHSDLIHCVSAVPEKPPAGDGLVTSTHGILLAVLTADCLPIILADTKRHAVGVFHAGWRGTVKRIVEKGVGEMRRYFGTRPSDLKAVIGPGIRSCCYQVGAEVRTAFESQFSYGSSLFRVTKETDEIHEKYPLFFLTSRAPGHSELPEQIFLDLAEANRRQLLDAGVPVKNISQIPLCTACRTDILFSHRAEHGVTGRMMAAAGVRDLNTRA